MPHCLGEWVSVIGGRCRGHGDSPRGGAPRGNSGTCASLCQMQPVVCPCPGTPRWWSSVGEDLVSFRPGSGRTPAAVDHGAAMPSDISHPPNLPPVICLVGRWTGTP
jgi:hypothetical protein